MLRKLKQRQLEWLSSEKGTIRKDWGGRLRVALAFPNRYALGMSNLGFQAVYLALNRREEIACERVFYPEPEDLNLVRQSPGSLISVESQRPIRDFDLLAFSIAYENDYPNVVEMLALAGMAPAARDRSGAEPLVGAGGVAMLLNPEPLAPFLDLVFVGEAEAVIPEFVPVWADLHRERSGGVPRRELLTALAQTVPGLYVPSLYVVTYQDDGTLAGTEPVSDSIPGRVRYRRADFGDTAPCRSVVLTPHAEFSNMTLLEIGRGCSRGCRFCAAGYIYRPARYHPAQRLIDSVRAGFPENPRLGLVSSAVSDHPQIGELCNRLVAEGASVSFSSLRADTIGPEVLSALRAGGHQAVAIAPEAGSARLRRVINKNLTEEHITHAAEQLTAQGILRLKLYFMIGLPTETFEDLEAIVELVKKIKHVVLKTSRGQKRLGTITVSVNSFVPKASTPFQWVPFAGAFELKERARHIQRALRKVPNVRVHFDLPKWAYIQAVMARGDRRAAAILKKAAIERLPWTQVLRSVPVNPDFWALRERDRDERFPWEVIDLGLRRDHLWEEYQRALEGKSTPPCPLDPDCRRCGVCEP